LQLGSKVGIPDQPAHATLEAVPCDGKDLIVRMHTDEFTSVCPVTAQPDFASVFLEYVPRRLLIESKSLKLFLGSFRNHPTFAENATALIGELLQEVLDPAWIRVTTQWRKRGGIGIDVLWERGELPQWHQLASSLGVKKSCIHVRRRGL